MWEFFGFLLLYQLPSLLSRAKVFYILLASLVGFLALFWLLHRGSRLVFNPSIAPIATTLLHFLSYHLFDLIFLYLYFALGVAIGGITGYSFFKEMDLTNHLIGHVSFITLLFLATVGAILLLGQPHPIIVFGIFYSIWLYIRPISFPPRSPDTPSPVATAYDSHEEYHHPLEEQQEQQEYQEEGGEDWSSEEGEPGRRRTLRKYSDDMDYSGREVAKLLESPEFRAFAAKNSWRVKLVKS